MHTWLVYVPVLLGIVLLASMAFRKKITKEKTISTIARSCALVENNIGILVKNQNKEASPKLLLEAWENVVTLLAIFDMIRVASMANVRLSNKLRDPKLEGLKKIAQGHLQTLIELLENDNFKYLIKLDGEPLDNQKIVRALIESAANHDELLDHASNAGVLLHILEVSLAEDNWQQKLSDLFLLMWLTSHEACAALALLHNSPVRLIEPRRGLYEQLEFALVARKSKTTEMYAENALLVNVAALIGFWNENKFFQLLKKLSSSQ